MNDPSNEYRGEQIELLGDGSIAIADTISENFAGVSFMRCDPPQPVDELRDVGLDDNEAGTFFRIVAGNQQSLITLRDAVQRAIDGFPTTGASHE